MQLPYCTPETPIVCSIWDIFCYKHRHQIQMANLAQRHEMKISWACWLVLVLHPATGSCATCGTSQLDEAQLPPIWSESFSPLAQHGNNTPVWACEHVWSNPETVYRTGQTVYQGTWGSAARRIWCSFLEGNSRQRSPRFAHGCDWVEFSYSALWVWQYLWMPQFMAISTNQKEVLTILMF